MQFSDKTKKILEFTGWYSAAVLFLFFIFQSLPGMPAVTEKKPERRELQAIAGNQQLQEALYTNGVLHGQLKQIQDMDKKLVLFLLNSSAATTVDSLRRQIKLAEESFKIQIDSSILAHKEEKWSDTLVGSLFAFRSDLENRRSQEDIRNALLISNMPGVHDVQSAFLESREAMMDKDIRIADLEAEIRILHSTNSRDTSNSGAATAGLVAAVALKKDYDELQKNFKNLSETNIKLTRANEKLKTQASVEPAPVEMKSSALDRKVDELTAELYFSTVDCNISRVDINQIISNSKQRRALLKQTMDLLTFLKSSANTNTQQRAEQKIQVLTKIISTVRD